MRNAALLDATLLVFKTLRVGFPGAEVFVYGNSLEWWAEAEVREACKSVNATFVPMTYRSHDTWIEWLIHEEPGPFWICDTDLVFFGKVEDWFIDLPLVDFAGRYEPEFDEEFTSSRHMARLHTALLWFNAPELRILMRKWMARVPPPWGQTAQMNLVRQHFVPLRGGRTLFFDTCAGLYHAGLGLAFTREQDAAFEHLHCGTYVDKIGQMPSLADLQKVHKSIYADPQRAAGLQRDQARYYRSRRPDMLVLEDGAAYVTNRKE